MRIIILPRNNKANKSVIITASAGANGSISPSGSVIVNKGSSQTFTFTPTDSNNYRVLSVIVDGINIGNPSSYTFTDVQTTHTITVNFIRYYLIVSTSDANGSISPSGTTSVNSGSSQAYNFTPNPNYVVGNVFIDGSSAGAPSSYTFSNVQANHTIDVDFQPYTPAGVSVWFGGNDTSFLYNYTSPTTVSDAADIVSGYVVSQATKSWQPLAATVNGHNCFNCVGRGGLWGPSAGTAGLSWITSGENDGSTIMVAFKTDFVTGAANNGAPILDIQNYRLGAWGSCGRVLLDRNNRKLSWTPYNRTNGQSYTVQSPNWTLAANGVSIATIRYSGLNVKVMANYDFSSQTNLDVITWGNNSNTRLSLGTQWGSTTTNIQYFLECIIFPWSLSDSDVNLNLNYLWNKWGGPE